MKRMPLVICFVLTMSICLTIPVIAQSTKLLLPETGFTIDLSLSPDKEFPEDFRSITIRSAGAITRLTTHDPIIRIPATRTERKKAFIWSADASGLKIDPSLYFLIGQYTTDAKPHTLLFLLSDAAASDATPLLIIGFSDQGVPFKVFERPYELTSFEQTNTGATITGNESIAQAMCDSGDPHAPSSTTYDPFSIFLLQPNAKPLYQLEASRDYNLKHYVWAGPHSSEATAVIYNLPGHPKIFAVPVARHDKLMAGLKCIP
jgi:hypothetical protein